MPLTDIAEEGEGEEEAGSPDNRGQGRSKLLQPPPSAAAGEQCSREGEKHALIDTAAAAEAEAGGTSGCGRPEEGCRAQTAADELDRLVRLLVEDTVSAAVAEVAAQACHPSEDGRPSGTPTAHSNSITLRPPHAPLADQTERDSCQTERDSCQTECDSCQTERDSWDSEGARRTEPHAGGAEEGAQLEEATRVLLQDIVDAVVDDAAATEVEPGHTQSAEGVTGSSEAAERVVQLREEGAPVDSGPHTLGQQQQEQVQQALSSAVPSELVQQWDSNGSQSTQALPHRHVHL